MPEGGETMGRTGFATTGGFGMRNRAWPIAAAWLVTTASLAGDEPARLAEVAIRGRVMDGQGKPVAGARVRLYRRADRWDRRNAVVEATTAGPDGSFRLAARPEPSPPPHARSLPRLVLLADHPGLAVGWRIIPDDAATFA